jgi:hypothetical protein
MGETYDAGLDDLANAWAKQLETNSSFTNSDIEELKSHFIELVGELLLRGLNEDEAYVIASARLGDPTILKSEFEEVNASIFQLRKTILLLSGVLVFMLSYFLMLFVSRLLVLILNWTTVTLNEKIHFVLLFVIVHHLIFLIFSIYFYFSGQKVLKRFGALKIKPHHTLGLFFAIIILASLDKWFRLIINDSIEFGGYVYKYLFTLFDYSGYTFPVIMIVCFIIFLKRYNSLSDVHDQHSVLSDNNQYLDKVSRVNVSDDLFVDVQLKSNFNLCYKEFLDKGLSDEEVSMITRRRLGIYKGFENNYHTDTRQKGTINDLLIIFSGILVYVFLYYLLFASTRMIFTFLQFADNNPALNIKRIWTYSILFHMVFIFFTTSVYIRDKNMIELYQRIKIKPVIVRWLLFLTFFLALVDRCFYPLSRMTFSRDQEMITKLYHVFMYANYTFPMTISACFLVLFNKYYRENVKTFC